MMSLTPSLLATLACPKCKGGLEHRAAESVLVCRTCKLAFEVKDGIPIMLLSEAKPL